MVFAFLCPCLTLASICGARSVSELPQPLGPRLCSVVAGSSSVFTTKLNGSKLHFVGNKWLHLALPRPVTRQGGTSSWGCAGSHQPARQ